MVDFGGVGATAMGALSSWVFWILVIIGIFGVTIGSMAMRKKAKFTFPCIILMDNGNGKMGVRFTRAGWFKSKKMFGGLIDYAGEKRLEVKDGRVIQKGNGVDFHEIGFKTAVICQEKSDDPKILIPISRFKLDDAGKNVLMSIAPADYRDACSKIISDAEKESLSKWEALAQILVFGVIGVILFISIIMTIQYCKNTMADANAIHKEAMGFYDKMLGKLSTTASTTAP
jgi:hypothetical protein